jgi:hypothetical protein
MSMAALNPMTMEPSVRDALPERDFAWPKGEKCGIAPASWP